MGPDGMISVYESPFSFEYIPQILLSGRAVPFDGLIDQGKGCEVLRFSKAPAGLCIFLDFRQSRSSLRLGKNNC